MRTIRRSNCAILHLGLKRTWFDLIASGVNNIDRLRDELDVERSQHATDIEQAEYHAEHHRKRLEAERDRLRDLVRRFVRLFEPNTIHPEGTSDRLLREARAAIGEDRP